MKNIATFNSYLETCFSNIQHLNTVAVDTERGTRYRQKKEGEPYGLTFLFIILSVNYLTSSLATLLPRLTI